MKQLLGVSGGKVVGWHVALEFKAQDCWIGAFWHQDGCCVDLWVCLLPMLPIHISWWWLPKMKAASVTEQSQQKSRQEDGE